MPRGSAPTYAWQCHKCLAVNPSGAGTCAACLFPAEASSAAIVAARGESVAKRNPEGNDDAWLTADGFPGIILPEGLYALFMVFISPALFFALLAEGRFALAGVLAAGVITASVGAVQGFRRRSRVLLLGAVWIVLLVAFLIATLRSP